MGRPLTIGNFVSSSRTGFILTAQTNTYTPYIVLGDDAYPDPSQDETITGTSYQEVLTNLPLGNEILTGLFLNVTTSGPGEPTQNYDPAHVCGSDRIYSTSERLCRERFRSQQPMFPILSDADIFTINVLPEGLQSTLALLPVHEQVTMQLFRSAAQSVEWTRRRDFQSTTSRSFSNEFALFGTHPVPGGVGQGSREHGGVGFSVQAYYDQPRITIFFRANSIPRHVVH